MFTPGKTSWTHDWVCEQPVSPLEEITIDNVRSYLLGFVDGGLLTLRRCADTNISAETNADLLPVFIRLYARGGDKVLAHVNRYYPHFVDQILAGQK